MCGSFYFLVQFQSVKNVIWQDAVFSFGALIFAVALLPAILTKRYPPISTCVVTALLLVAFAVADASLGLVFATAFSLLDAALWGYMGAKQLRGKSAQSLSSQGSIRQTSDQDAAEGRQ